MVMSSANLLMAGQLLLAFNVKLARPQLWNRRELQVQTIWEHCGTKKGKNMNVLLISTKNCMTCIG